jgi:hypothetical protein
MTELKAQSQIALRVSRGLLALSIAGSLAIVSLPFGSRTVAGKRASAASGGIHMPSAIPRQMPLGAQAEIDRDPFAAAGDASATRESRQASSVPSSPTALITSVPAKAIEIPLLVGTVIDQVHGSFAVCSLGSGAPRSVRVGERIGSYRLDSVAQGIAIVIDSAGRALTLRLRLRS